MMRKRSHGKIGPVKNDKYTKETFEKEMEGFKFTPEILSKLKINSI